MIVFGKEWFGKHQSKLLFLLNNPLLKYWFRWIMRIRTFDLPHKTKIFRIEPNCFTWQTGNPDEFTTDFRTHDKYGKRLYHAFKYVWWTLHCFDWLLEKLQLIFRIPKLSFGFDTLTVYPNADPETNSTDGTAKRASTGTWSEVRDGLGTYKIDGGSGSATGALFQITTVINSNYGVIQRAMLFFYTAALTSSATITNAILSVYGVSKSNTLNCSPALNIYDTTSTSTTALAITDYEACGTTAQCDTAITYANLTVTTYNDFTLNATGLANINLTGLTRFCTREANYDVANSEPTWIASRTTDFRACFAETAETTSDPKLVVTYTLPAATFVPKVIIN